MVWGSSSRGKQITNVVLNLRNLRTLVDAITEWVSNFDRTGFGTETFEELIVDPRLNENSRSGTACLTMIPAYYPKFKSMIVSYECEMNPHKIPCAAQLTA